MNILLLGAGFTRNWGGWLASELMGDLLGRVATRPDLHKLLRFSSGFEEALSVVQAKHRQNPTPETATDLAALQGAVMDSFAAMNKALSERGSMEFTQYLAMQIQPFLHRFDAIFTLNQDLLFELHYNAPFFDQSPFDGHYFPGMSPSPNGFNGGQADRLSATWTPDKNFALQDKLQPIFKLHGSVNWRDSAGGDVLVMGGSKQNFIAEKEILRWYFDQFISFLNAGGTRLMSIGYGFRDQHIDDAIFAAHEKAALQLFLVNPEGSEVFDRNSGAAIRTRDRMHDVFLVGESRRPLSSTFFSDPLEHGKLMRFFDQ